MLPLEKRVLRPQSVRDRILPSQNLYRSLVIPTLLPMSCYPLPPFPIIPVPPPPPPSHFPKPCYANPPLFMPCYLPVPPPLLPMPCYPSFPITHALLPLFPITHTLLSPATMTPYITKPPHSRLPLNISGHRRPYHPIPYHYYPIPSPLPYYLLPRSPNSLAHHPLSITHTPSSSLPPSRPQWPYHTTPIIPI